MVFDGLSTLSVQSNKKKALIKILSPERTGN